jgi:hypothetical protein
LPEQLNEGDARLLEAAWQLYTEHGIQIENSKLGGWSETIAPALEACRSLISVVSEAESLTIEVAFSQYAKG